MIKCECGKELGKITRKHLESKEHKDKMLDIENSNQDSLIKEVKENFPKLNIPEKMSKSELTAFIKSLEYERDKLYQDKQKEFMDNYNEGSNDDKIVLSRNLRPSLRKEPKRFVRIFYNRNTRNSFLLADYSDYPIFEYEGRTFSLDEVALEQEGIPEYWIFLDFNFSVGLKFNPANDTLVEKGYSPDDMNAYIHSQAVDTMYRIKRKFGLSDLYTHISVGVICILGTLLAVFMLGGFA